MFCDGNLVVKNSPAKRKARTTADCVIRIRDLGLLGIRRDLAWKVMGNIPPNTLFKSLAEHFHAQGIEAEAISDAQGEVVSLRFYLGEKAFTIHPTQDEGGRLGIEIGEYEVLDTDQPEDRIDHVVEVLRKTGFDV